MSKRPQSARWICADHPHVIRASAWTRRKTTLEKRRDIHRINGVAVILEVFNGPCVLVAGDLPQIINAPCALSIRPDFHKPGYRQSGQKPDNGNHDHDLEERKPLLCDCFHIRSHQPLRLREPKHMLFTARIMPILALATHPYNQTPQEVKSKAAMGWPSAPKTSFFPHSDIARHSRPRRIGFLQPKNATAISIS
jgi:hypothetical protein